MTPSELAALRAEVRQLRTRTTRKIARLKRDKGANVASGQYDPRRNVGAEKRYTARQLEAYKRQLTEFNSRRTQFVPDSNGRGLRADRWRKLQALESRYNELASQYFGAISDIRVGSTAETLADVMGRTTTPHPVPGNTGAKSLYQQFSRKSTGVAGPKALEKLIAKFERDEKGGIIKTLVENGRRDFAEMIKTVGDEKLKNAVAALSDAQFSVIWQYTEFAHSISHWYELMKMMLAKDDEPWHAQLVDDAMGTAYELAEWAGTLNLGSRLGNYHK